MFGSSLPQGEHSQIFEHFPKISYKHITDMSLLLRRFIIGAIILLALDVTWIQLNLPAYKAATEAIQHSPMKVKVLPATLSYCLLLMTLWGILMYAEETHKLHSRAYFVAVAFMVGFIVYGVYNATNAALLTDYDMRLAIKDTLWGGIVLAIPMSFCLWVV